MKMFCPNCGTDNEGTPGARVTCRACSAQLRRPRRHGPRHGAAVDGRAPGPGFGGQPVQPFTPPPAVPQPQPAWAPPAQAANPAAAAPLAMAGATPPNNTLAIVSLVSGVLCCVPFASIVAIVTGVMAKNQIKQSGGTQGGDGLATAGLILGGLSLVTSCVFGLLGVLGNLGNMGN